jgi:hypothetical protein
MKKRPLLEPKPSESWVCVAPKVGLCEIDHPGCIFYGPSSISEVRKRRHPDCKKCDEELAYFIVVGVRE